MVHHTFENVPDPYFADVFSDIFQMKGEYKALMPSFALGENPAEFPTEPAEICVISGVAVDQIGIIRRPAFLIANRHTRPNVNHIIEVYGRTIGEGQQASA